MPTLYIIRGPDKGRTFNVDHSPTLIGRDSPDVKLSDNTLSRRHAQLIRHNSTWEITDLNSSNGTYVNGVKVAGALQIKQGDQIRCGMTLSVFDGPKKRGVSGDLSSSLKIDQDGNIVESAIMATVPSMEDSILIAGPEASSAVKNLQLLYELSTAIGSIFDRLQLLERVMDIIFDNLRADRGFVLLLDEETGELKPEVLRYRSEKHSGQIAISHTIVDYVVEHQEGVICSNAMRDPRFAKGKSVHDFTIHSALCAPITVRNHNVGVIYIDTTVATHTYSTDQLQLLTAIGFQTGLALEHARLYESGVQAERLAAVGETVAYLSHGIKNILQSLQSAADLVDLGMKKNKIDIAKQGWAILQRSLGRVQNLVLNMLAFSKARRPNLELTQINHIIEEIVEMLSGQAQDKQIGLFTELDEHLPPIPIDIDGVQQAVLNLVLNAMDAVEENTGAITIKTAYNNDDNQEMVLTVSDNGKGITKEDIKDIFKAFQSDKGQGGTGLGLAVVKKIVDEHHGRVSVASTVNKGTTFAICLPVSNEEFTDSDDTSGPGKHDTDVNLELRIEN